MRYSFTTASDENTKKAKLCDYSRTYASHGSHFCQTTQPAFTCSKLTIETLEQGVKYVQS